LNLLEKARLWDTQNMLDFTAGAIPKVVAFVAPKIVGGAMAPSPFGGLTISSRIEAIATHLVKHGHRFVTAGIFTAKEP
jgi:riboflavin biosynthesis pyrimidine reductase